MSAMHTPGMRLSYENRDSSRRVKGFIIVVALHALIGYLVVSGLARKGLNLIKKPLEAVVIQEVIIPPPPPPPPKKIEPPKEMPKIDAPPPPYVPPSEVTPQVSTAPSIVSVATPPPAPAVIAPPPPPPAPTGPRRTAIGVACPTQVQPEMPRKALQDGTTGVVKAQIHIKGGVIQGVEILSGPRVFHAAVKAAMMQYKCITDANDVVATQEFDFKID
ncbi:MAG: energy transducer TonB [Betaproteobacteria bacterium]